ncbi:MAG: hypothetical protein WAO76_14460 [Georgfuchsia sp.]
MRGIIDQQQACGTEHLPELSRTGTAANAQTDAGSALSTCFSQGLSGITFSIFLIVRETIGDQDQEAVG